jgi:hypothetical protein
MLKVLKSVGISSTGDAQNNNMRGCKYGSGQLKKPICNTAMNDNPS